MQFESMSQEEPLTEAELLIQEITHFMLRGEGIIDQYNALDNVKDKEKRAKLSSILQTAAKQYKLEGDAIVEKVTEYIKKERQEGNVRNFILNKIYIQEFQK